MSASAAPRQARPPVWRDERVLRVIAQIVFLALVVAFLRFLWGNLVENLADIGQQIGFDWLRQPAGFAIRDASGFTPGQAVLQAIQVGIGNTAQVAFIGIVIATLIGVVVGIARLSTNWLVRTAAALYVELFRNVPVLLIIIFTYTAVVLQLPPINEAGEYLDAFVFSNRGMNVPWLRGHDHAGAYLVVAGVALAVAGVVAVWRTRRYDATGEPHHRVLWALAVVAVILAGGYVALDGPVSVTLPERNGRAVTGGIGLGPEYAALLLALAVYTASHISEIVRGSILAVPKGQTEAANAIALSGFQRMRFVILPQALRIAVPPVANQYLNLAKNSSLAVFIGYPEITRIIGTVIGNGNPAPPAIAVLMAVYLMFSLGISVVANFVNRSLALKGRS